jgi:cation diffusion facilitator CzcD-associated flavoprotein CzcO
MGFVDHDAGIGARFDARFDAVIIGAGFSGLYMLYELRREGLRTIVLGRPTPSAARGWSTGIRAPGAT